MDHYSSRIIIDHKLNELRAQGAEARLARTAHRDGPSLRSRLVTMASRLRAHGSTTAPAGQDRRPAASRPA